MCLDNRKDFWLTREFAKISKAQVRGQFTCSLVLLGIMGAVIYAAFQREPHNRPAYFPGRIPGRRVTVCAGDSLTAATWSAD